MRISDWSSDVCSSDLILRIAERGDFRGDLGAFGIGLRPAALEITGLGVDLADREADAHVPTRRFEVPPRGRASLGVVGVEQALVTPALHAGRQRSEEHTSELQSLMRISYAVFCLKKKKKNTHIHHYCRSRVNKKS